MTTDVERSGGGSQGDDERVEALAHTLSSFAAAPAGGLSSGGVAPQKWVQCASCDKWRKVPYDLNDEDIPEDWACENNVWDEEHQSCSVSQALSDEQIDEILALQEGPEGAGGPARMQVENAEADDEGQGSSVRRVGPRSSGPATPRNTPSVLSRTASGKVTAPSPRHRPHPAAAAPKGGGGGSSRVATTKGGGRLVAVAKPSPHSAANNKLA
eukprot:CAMPEP_0177752082 /NCGR_PEP_ID=MMETSP0491_2-20121128/727_1 /TAXON_ID=63592 /ORGANISM="Tetraselmis chuii, Strain PLY429" /LENGTH=212 /DNA_ID=CAMNT_0019267257 /DNA_START=364 /DNA_END=999 /DNA_ORIENTATION=+